MDRITVLTWNLFHGRSEPSAGRPLRDEFARALAGLSWDVAFLQEAPWHWLRPLALAARASGASALTSRNTGSFARRAVAGRAPDLIKSNEGGSNQILVRGRRMAEVRRLTLTVWPERRRLLWTRLDDGLCVANLHASADDRPAAFADVRRAARASCSWAAERPLVFGGDFNLRMSETPEAFEWLRGELGLEGARGGRAIDHLLTRHLEVVAPAGALPAESHRAGPLPLSDHAPVVATYALRSRRPPSEEIDGRPAQAREEDDRQEIGGEEAGAQEGR